MAEELDDGEFWLPPQFLNDDDIHIDFCAPSGSDPDLSSVTGSDPVTESEDDELLSLLTRQLGCSSIGVCDVHSSKVILSPTNLRILYLILFFFLSSNLI